MDDIDDEEARKKGYCLHDFGRVTHQEIPWVQLNHSADYYNRGIAHLLVQGSHSSLVHQNCQRHHQIDAPYVIDLQQKNLNGLKCY